MIVDKKVLLKEIFRKMIHLCSAAIPFLLKIAYWPVIIGFMIIVVLYYFCELLRLEGHPVPLISLITNTAARERDEGKIVLGPITLVFGILFPCFFAFQSFYQVTYQFIGVMMNGMT